jgi:hypothetical protein
MRGGCSVKEPNPVTFHRKGAKITKGVHGIICVLCGETATGYVDNTEINTPM